MTAEKPYRTPYDTNWWELTDEEWEAYSDRRGKEIMDAVASGLASRARRLENDDR
jgi:hypothetical protein